MKRDIAMKKIGVLYSRVRGTRRGFFYSTLVVKVDVKIGRIGLGGLGAIPGPGVAPSRDSLGEI